MSQEHRDYLLFGGGFALAAILSVSFEAVRYVPMALAFGGLCFGCGVLLFLFLSLRRREAECVNRSIEELNRLHKEFTELSEKESKLEEEKELFETEKEKWEDEKEAWKATHDEQGETE